MTSLRSMLSATIATGALLAGAASTARADIRPLFTWSGTVDREAIIVMRGASIETQGDGFESNRDARVRVATAVPRALGIVRVERADGRGEVEVIQQPSQFNGYTTRVRVRDRQSGADRYRLVVTWQGNDDDYRGNGRGRDRDDRRDNGNHGGWYKGDRDGRDGDRDGRYDDRDSRGDFGTRRDAGALRFSAVVDDVAEIRIRGRRVEAFSRSGAQLRGVRFDVRGASLPEYALPLDLRRLSGRGNVVIAQYPRAYNNWTAIIKVDDSRGGADNYEFDLRW